MRSDDRRSFERFPFSSRLEVRRSSIQQEMGVLEATALDVSVGGFGFRSSAPLSIGEIIAVSMPELSEPLGITKPALDSDDDDPSLQIVAVVRHVSTNGFGEYVVGAERHV